MIRLKRNSQVKQDQKKRRRKSLARELGENVFFRGAGDVVRSHREERGMTLEELASGVGVDKSTVSRWETNESPLSDRAIKRLAKVFQVRMDALMLACLEKMQPQLAGSPFGRLLRDLVRANAQK
jgi:transcriptional regulator with XRE-family HTH domain